MMHVRPYVLVLGLLMAAACGSSPTSPSALPPTAPPSSGSPRVTGHVLATIGGAPLVGVTLSAGGSTATTDASGFFVLMPTGGKVPLLVTGGGIITRNTFLNAATHDTTIDVIRQDGQFDLAFYRQLARDAFDGSGVEALKHITANVNVYLRTVDDAGTPIDGALLDATANTITSFTPTLTVGRYQASVTRGTATMEGVSGWRTVKWASRVPSDGACARSQVGVDGGFIELDYKTGGNCSCGGLATRTRTLKHELGHSIDGLGHSSNGSDLMSTLPFVGCDQNLSTRELYHIQIIMARPNGNTDQDNDPASASPF